MIYQSDFKKYKFKKDDDFENLLIKSQNEIFQETNFEVSMFFNEIRNSFDAKNHPDVRNGKKSEIDFYYDFIYNFEIAYNYLNGSQGDGYVIYCYII